ncbi:ribosome biogenesis GTP-binding protein YihA/YsxC [Buchnera aphidicola]|uniref:ribosome biogenesis GTP-binding protein YihA/YsxC n=1 Tax=Buchnera aphidicola TaxID=9 RepID=UPI003464B030
MRYYYNNATFLTSATNFMCNHVPKNGIEIGFVGYSNSGKSTAINALTNKSKLSRFSKNPGRTNMINFFTIYNNLRFVDFPGYGYSLYEKNINKKYNLILHYLEYRTCLKGIILFVDIRRLLRYMDKKILQLVQYKSVKCVILLTKCDKLSKLQQNRQLNILRKELTIYFKDINIILFSSLQKIGISLVLHVIHSWYFFFQNDG